MAIGKKQVAGTQHCHVARTFLPGVSHVLSNTANANEGPDTRGLLNIVKIICKTAAEI